VQPSLVNIGCGSTWHPAWTNLDVRSLSSHVRAWDVCQGLPFDSEQVDACYASHVLEHLTRPQARALLVESFRVLRPGGIIRLAVPDLEAIAREYLDVVARADKGERAAMAQYEWIALELLDQLVRDKSGGEMEPYLRHKALDNAEYVIARIGPDARSYMGMQGDVEHRFKSEESPARPVEHTMKALITRTVRKFRTMAGSADHAGMTLCRILLGKEGRAAFREGVFRRSGECHRWMYDRFSLRQLLEQCGFAEVRSCTPFESRIAGFASFGLDVVNGKVRKPDSLFMEAVKLQ
jgi:predicted SAM-dependent methyltransferase